MIQFPDPEYVRTRVSGIIDVTGTNVILTYVIDSVLCPTCNGNDPFCITCGGNVYIQNTATFTQKGKIRWKSLEQKMYRPEGQYMEGDCTVTFLNSPQLEQIMQSVTSVLVDNRTCVVKKWNIQGIDNHRLYLILEEDMDSGRTG